MFQLEIAQVIRQNQLYLSDMKGCLWYVAEFLKSQVLIIYTMEYHALQKHMYVFV